MINPAMLRHTVLLCTLLTISSILHAEDLPAPIKALQAQGVELVGTFEDPQHALLQHEQQHASGGVAAVAQITPDLGGAQELFRRMVFNILVDNTDDHEKNHALLV